MSEERIINSAIELISRYFGKNSADLYKNYYKNKSKEDIIASVNELLTEMLGPEMAETLVQELEN